MADSRESNGANPFLPAFIAQNNRASKKLSAATGGGNIKFLEKNITTGDYCILMRTPANRLNMTVLIERKTWKDVAASIKDGRMTAQLERLSAIRKKKKCSVFYIIEGRKYNLDDSRKLSGLPISALHSKIRHNFLRGLPFIQTVNQEETAQTIVAIARDVMKLCARGEIIVDEPRAQRAPLTPRDSEYLAALDELNEKFADSNIAKNISAYSARLRARLVTPPAAHDCAGGAGDLPQELCERIIHKDIDIIITMWDKIEGVSQYLASLLMAKYSLGYFIEHAAELIGKLAQLQYQSGISLGESRAEKIAASAMSSETHEKILSAIPGVSDEIAQIIIEHYPFVSICHGRVSEDMIAQLTHGESCRKIGQKCADNIARICRATNR